MKMQDRLVAMIENSQAEVENINEKIDGLLRDAEKQSAAAILGYRVIRATSRQVEDGRCLSWIQQALGLRSAA